MLEDRRRALREDGEFLDDYVSVNVSAYTMRRSFRATDREATLSHDVLYSGWIPSRPTQGGNWATTSQHAATVDGVTSDRNRMIWLARPRARNSRGAGSWPGSL